MQGLTTAEVNSFNLPGDAPGQIFLVINSSIFNPSSVEMSIGDVYFDILFENHTLGTAFAPNLTLERGLYYHDFLNIHLT